MIISTGSAPFPKNFPTTRIRARRSYPKTMTREDIQKLRQTAFRRFYFRPSFLLKKLFELRTVSDVRAVSKSLRSLFWLAFTGDLFMKRHANRGALRTAPGTEKRNRAGPMKRYFAVLRAHILSCRVIFFWSILFSRSCPSSLGNIVYNIGRISIIFYAGWLVRKEKHRGMWQSRRCGHRNVFHRPRVDKGRRFFCSTYLLKPEGRAWRPSAASLFPSSSSFPWHADRHDRRQFCGEKSSDTGMMHDSFPAGDGRVRH